MNGGGKEVDLSIGPTSTQKREKGGVGAVELTPKGGNGGRKV